MGTNRIKFEQHTGIFSIDTFGNVYTYHRTQAIGSGYDNQGNAEPL